MIRIRNWALRRCDQSVVISQKMAINFEKLNIPNSSVIPNWGKDLSVDKTKIDQLRNDWKLSDKLIISYSGNFGFVHEYQTVKKLIECCKNYQHIEFLFIGSGQYLNKLKHFTSLAQVKNIQFKPYQTQETLADSLSLADFHLITLKPEMEGLVFPSKFYTVCAVSKPILFIGNKFGELGTLITQHECGVCFNPGESQKIVDYLENINLDRAKINRLGKNARNLFEENYTLSKAVSSWNKVLVQV